MKLRLLGLLFFGSIVVASAQKAPVMVVNPSYRLVMNADKGTIESFRVTQPDHDLLIPNHGSLPLFKVEFRGEDLKYTSVSSSQAKKVSVVKMVENGSETIVINYEGIGDLGLGARVTIRCPQNEALTHWSLEVDNPTNSWIAHVQFPIVEVPFDSNPTAENRSSILSSLYDGVLSSPVTPATVIGSWRRPRANTPEVWRQTNYPRECTAQLLAYYNNSGGLYIACEDPKGLPKLISPMIEKDGVTMGFGHYPGTHGPGKTKLAYEVALGTFHGDWYAAADIYRNWAAKQPFTSRKIAQRSDIPKWLLQPLVGVTFPMRGQADWDSPAAINPEYTPATNALPYIDKLAKAFNTPLLPIVFNWEHSGPWVQPEAFPPVGGEAAMKKFMKIAKAKGWHPVLYGNGINWVVGQRNTGYNGMEYYKTHGGDSAIARSWNGTLMGGAEGGWRRLYPTCVYTQPARKMVLGMTQGMAKLGPEVIQQFDQGVGAVHCYATDHGHPPVPGPWMSEAFASLLKLDNEAARSQNPNVVVSCEGAPPEVYLQDFQFWDARIGGGGSLNCSLFAYIYHEYMPAHSGAYLNSVNDEALRASVARAIVKGYMLNFTLRDKGLIEFDWNHIWDRAIPDQEAILDWGKRATHFRNSVARDFLVYGQMQRPFTITGVPTRDYGYGPEPLIQSETWKAADGRFGVAMANYSDNQRGLRLELPGQGTKNIVIHIDDKSETRSVTLPYVVDMQLPSRSLALVEIK
jgi:hypothetical protein